MKLRVAMMLAIVHWRWMERTGAYFKSSFVHSRKWKSHCALCQYVIKIDDSGFGFCHVNCPMYRKWGLERPTESCESNYSAYLKWRHKVKHYILGIGTKDEAQMAAGDVRKVLEREYLSKWPEFLI